MLEKPADLFGRKREWDHLGDFVGSSRVGATLGLVYGRRRQGKTLMLEKLTERTGGFLFSASQQPEALNLAELSDALAAHLDMRFPIALRNWPEALDALLRLGEAAPTTVVIDEFPYLVSATPGLPSYLQRALSPMSHAKQHTKTRLILCGSAITTMSQLLGASAPLRGRAVVELILRPFGYREAAAFWNVGSNPELAFRLNALVGGTPAYLDMCGGSGPQDLAGFDAWVHQWLLHPGNAMFREGSMLLREEPSIVDPTSYTATLAVVSAGNHRRSQIAAALGRESGAVTHLLSGLQDIGLLDRVQDALRDKRTVYHVAEPVVRLHQLVVRRYDGALIGGHAERVWSENADTVASKIYGPHFEELARQWTFEHASKETLGEFASWVRPTEIACREHRRGHELDLVVMKVKAFEPDRILAIGEAKGTLGPVDIGQLERLEHLRNLLPSDKVGSPPKLLLFGRSGFTDRLIQAASKRGDVELIDLDRMYNGD